MYMYHVFLMFSTLRFIQTNNLVQPYIAVHTLAQVYRTSTLMMQSYMDVHVKYNSMYGYLIKPTKRTCHGYHLGRAVTTNHCFNDYLFIKDLL